ncbi:unnamed protein product [Arabidopsis thaliana]|uniref:(thale cress) hypothetical protein n=1 Tax=Arabidopsis thaliana TaxID=3702 RepID=A0A7G2F1N2_ARATH|nr:unnamed protein product [Arabidopsis thaliana]
MFSKVSILLFSLASLLLFRSTTGIEFIYNSNFTTTNTLLLDNATVKSPPSILTLTNQTTFSIGRGLYPSRINASSSSASPLPFATSFIFSMAPFKHLSPGHGFAFVFLPFSETSAASSSQHLGLFNFTNNGDPNSRIFAVEFDVFANQEFNDINDNHVGVDVNSLTSVASETAGFYGGRDGQRFTELKLNSGENYQAWIEFNGSAINVTMARASSRKPIRPLISIPLNLTGVLLDDMFVGFTASTGQLVQSHRILSWSFSNSNFSIGDALITRNLPSFKLSGDSVLKSKGFIAGVSSGVVLLVSVIGLLCFYVVRRRRQRLEGDVEDWETEYWPHRVQYKDVLEATKGFSDENMIGYGGNSKVYRGVLEGKEVAVKRIMMSPRESVGATSEFLAEVSSLGRLRHKNIVGLKGWSKKGGESLILIYEYMENGSVDKRIFDCNEIEGIVEWIWGLMEKDKVVDGLDERIKANGVFVVEEVEMALRIGLLCVHPDPRVRPKMRQVVQILEQGRLVEDGGEREISLLERVKSSYLLETGEGSRQQHPTFQDVWNSSSYSNSFQTYDSILHGR